MKLQQTGEKIHTIIAIIEARFQILVRMCENWIIMENSIIIYPVIINHYFYILIFSNQITTYQIQTPKRNLFLTEIV